MMCNWLLVLFEQGKDLHGEDSRVEDLMRAFACVCAQVLFELA